MLGGRWWVEKVVDQKVEGVLGGRWWAEKSGIDASFYILNSSNKFKKKKKLRNLIKSWLLPRSSSFVAAFSQSPVTSTQLLANVL